MRFKLLFSLSQMIRTRQQRVQVRSTYTAQEYKYFYDLYNEAGQSGRAAAALFAARHPNAPRKPNYKVFIGAATRLSFNGIVVPARDQAGDAGGILFLSSLSLCKFYDLQFGTQGFWGKVINMLKNL